MRELLPPSVPIVIDPGSYRWRVGFANADRPKSSFITEHRMLDGTAVEEDGHITHFESTELSLIYYERYINHGLRILHCDPKSVSLCLALPVGYTEAYRNKLAEMLFERIGAKSIFFASQPLLSGFSSNRPSCLVIDSGYTYTSIYGINDLYPERSTEYIYPMGGRDIDAYLKSLVGGRLIECTDADLSYIKSHFCSVSPKELPANFKRDVEVCQMPDGQTVKLGKELELAPELLFQPTLNAVSRAPALKKAIQSAVAKLTDDKKAVVLKDVFLSGGSMKFRGLAERLTKGCLKGSRIRSHPEAELAVWKGGAVFASMSTFSSMVITRERWREYGEVVVQRKWL